MKYSLQENILIFLKRSLVFPILLFSSISLHWSPRKAFLSLLAILWNSAFRCFYLSFSPLLFTSLLFTAICKASSDSHFAFLHFFSMGMVLIPVSCTMSQTFVHSSSRPSCACLIDRVPDELWMEVHDIVQETGIKTIPMEKKRKKQKWLSEKALQIAVKRRQVKSKGEKER